jgi:outer membrane protein TolC
MPLFGGGRTHAGIKAASAQRDLARAQLRSRVLAVAQEVRIAHTDEQESAATLAAAERQHAAARAAFEESRARYLEGLIPYLNVLAALGADQAAQLTLLDAQRARLRARVRLHGALGGTWTSSSLPENTP